MLEKWIGVAMATMKQVGLLAAGCQPWNHEVCAANGDRFAYCATLAIYIYQVKNIWTCAWLMNGGLFHKGFMMIQIWYKYSLKQICIAKSILNQLLIW